MQLKQLVLAKNRYTHSMAIIHCLSRAVQQNGHEVMTAYRAMAIKIV